jgi:hypothetical protein
MHPFNPFLADVANKRVLGSAPKSHFCDLTGKTEVIDLSDLMTFLIDLWCLDCKQTQRAFNVFKNTLNWLKIDSVDQKLFKIQLTRVWELLTRRWNAWHWERHYVFTAGGERVKVNGLCLLSQTGKSTGNNTGVVAWRVFKVQWHLNLNLNFLFKVQLTMCG